MKRILLIAIVASLCTKANAQRFIDTVIKYYNYDWEEVDPEKEYVYFFRIGKKTKDSVWLVKDYYQSTKNVQMECVFLDDEMTVRDGKAYYYYQDGSLSQECSYYQNNFVGLFRKYHKNGQLSDSARYKSTGIPYHEAFKWDKNGHLTFHGIYDIKGSGEGYETEYYEDGKVSSFGKYTEGYVRDSVWTYYYDNGNPSVIEEYYLGRVFTYKCFNEEGELQQNKCDTAIIYPKQNYDVDEYMSNIFSRTALCKDVIDENIFGGDLKAYVRFIVKRDGTLDAEVLYCSMLGSSTIIEKLIRSLPAFEPAIHKNRPVEYDVVMKFP